MATFNLDYRDEQAVIDFCGKHQKGLLIKKAFASGHLCQQSKDPIQASMDFIFSHQGVSSVIVGTINPQHLQENVAAVEKSLAE